MTLTELRWKLPDLAHLWEGWLGGHDNPDTTGDLKAAAPTLADIPVRVVSLPDPAEVRQKLRAWLKLDDDEMKALDADCAADLAQLQDRPVVPDWMDTCSWLIWTLGQAQHAAEDAFTKAWFQSVGVDLEEYDKAKADELQRTLYHRPKAVPG